MSGASGCKPLRRPLAVGANGTGSSSNGATVTRAAEKEEGKRRSGGEQHRVEVIDLPLDLRRRQIALAVNSGGN